MKNNEVAVGSTYTAKIGTSVVPVRIVSEKWSGDKHVGWNGLNTLTNRPVRIKSPAKLRSAVGGTTNHSEQLQDDKPAKDTGDKKPAEKGTKEKPAKPAKKAGAPKPPKIAKVKKLGGLDAAAKVLEDAGKPMGCKEIMAEVFSRKLWATNGKTPESTVYAAIIREIASKGSESRFKKTARGQFEFAGAPAGKAA
ncbi:MAG: winged helix-turn-helix domain-containing protein [Pyrinomonadaceae bacterium]|nr:winged helix-turn-helix domain-containing protein [Phycisphaerales bacterium]